MRFLAKLIVSGVSLTKKVQSGINRGDLLLVESKVRLGNQIGNQIREFIGINLLLI